MDGYRQTPVSKLRWAQTDIVFGLEPSPGLLKGEQRLIILLNQESVRGCTGSAARSSSVATASPRVLTLVIGSPALFFAQRLARHLE